MDAMAGKYYEVGDKEARAIKSVIDAMQENYSYGADEISSAMIKVMNMAEKQADNAEEQWFEK